jgi:hypothetical protein
MARARNIKPSLFKNELLGVADPLLTILFVGLWCLADRDGRLEDRPMRIRAEIFPYREKLDINRYLTELARLGFIHRYEASGTACIEVVNFKKHQAPHHTERPSELPERTGFKPTSLQGSGDLTVNPPLSDGEAPKALHLIPDSLIPDSLLQDSGGKPSDDGSPPAASLFPVELPKPVITITTNTGDEFPVYAEMIQDFAELYPAVDVPQELRAMRAWAISNPKQRKTKAGMMRFINGWLSKEQDKPAPAKPAAAFQTPTERAVANFVADMEKGNAPH